MIILPSFADTVLLLKNIPAKKISHNQIDQLN